MNGMMNALDGFVDPEFIVWAIAVAMLIGILAVETVIRKGGGR